MKNPRHAAARAARRARHARQSLDRARRAYHTAQDRVTYCASRYRRSPDPHAWHVEHRRAEAAEMRAAERYGRARARALEAHRAASQARQAALAELSPAAARRAEARAEARANAWRGRRGTPLLAMAPPPARHIRAWRKA